MNDKIIAAREVIGAHLSKVRQGKKISKYRIMQETGLQMNIINSIERGSTSYTIDSFLKYAQTIGVYILFGDNLDKKEDIIGWSEKNEPVK